MLFGNRLTRATARFLITLIALSCVVRAHPWHPPTHTPQTQTKTSDIPLSAFHLDGDLIADRIELESQGFTKRISIRFGDRRKQDLGFTTNSHEPGHLVAGDIDCDGDVDLIWLASTAQKTAVILINQGEGSFAEARDSAAYSSELDELFNIGDPTDKRLIPHPRKSLSLTSSTFSDIAPELTSQLVTTPLKQCAVNAAPRTADRLGCLANDPQRGPPSILS